MNIKDHFRLSRHFLPAIALYPTQQSENVYILVIVNIQSFISQFFGVVGPLGENLDFFSLLGFDKFKQILITKPNKSSCTQSEL